MSFSNSTTEAGALPGAGRTVLVADDDRGVRFVLEQALGRAGYRVHVFPEGHALLEHLAHHGGDLVITDILMPAGSGLDLLNSIKASHPDLPVIVITAQSTLRNAVQAFERGAFDYLPKPFDIQKVVDLVGRALDQRKSQGRALPAEPVDMERFGGIIGSSRAMQEIFRTIGRLSHSEMTVLIHGESGTGKELVARAVHAYSPRRAGPFTAINMAAIPRHLIESELFGHEKGAFTGAISQRAGHFERSKGGSLFLDEIGDMPMEAQTRLLRVLQDGTFTRVGGTENLRADARIIAATHQDLPRAIAEGRFREDLFYRLNVIPLHVPSLRSRRQDIPLLTDYFLLKAARELDLSPKRFTSAGMDKLVEYDWPGNVRELENLVHRLMVLVPDEVIGPDRLDLPTARPAWSAGSAPRPPTPEMSRGESVGSSDPERCSLSRAVLEELDRYFAALGDGEASEVYDLIVNQVEAALIARVLRETRGNRLRAADVLGINRNTLRKKMRDLGIEGRGRG
ncbi:MAG: nitrogen regulation protein NR(I) [Magnetococcus sp. WYHC-3]